MDAAHAVEQPRNNSIAPVGGGNAHYDVGIAIGAVENVFDGEEITQRGDIAGDRAVAEGDQNA